MRTACLLLLLPWLAGCSSLSAASPAKSHSLDCSQVSADLAAGTHRSFCGYFKHYYSYFYLYETRESYDAGDFSSAVTVDYDDCFFMSGTPDMERLDGSLVKVEGVLEEHSYATQGFSIGRIDGVAVIESADVRVSCAANELSIDDLR